MSAHSFLDIGGHLFYGTREGYVPELVALFTEQELVDDGERYGYESRAIELLDRLQLHGFTSGRVKRELETAVAVWHGHHPNPGADAMGVPLRDAAMIRDELRAFVNSTDDWATYEEPQDVYRQLDPRTILRLALDVVYDPTLPVCYNLDALASWQLLVRGTPIADQAREERRENLARDAALVILTEGSSDSQLLTEAVRVTHPHLVGFLRFMDFSSGAEGSAANLAKLVRSFAGAGIANRVVAIADNDTAAYDALAKLKREGLPDGYRVLHYPDLPLLSQYPTLGPQLGDPIVMDVNSKAGSLEMYLGRELLAVNGDLVPVQWTGYIESQKSYQGAISTGDKRRVQDAFRRKVGDALRDPTIDKGQDWSGIRAIVETILGAFD